MVSSRYGELGLGAYVLNTSVGSLRVQCRADVIFVCWSCQIMDAVDESCIEYLGYCLAAMWSDFVGYLYGRFGYNLVSCTLSGTQS